MSKGISPIIATVLLLMMTVAAAGGAYVWMTSLQTQIQKQVEDTAGSITGSSQLEFQFRYRKCNATETGGSYYHNEIELILENTGQATIEQGPVGLTLIDEQGSDLEFVQNNGGMQSDFPVDTFLALNFNVSTDLVPENDYVLKVSLPGGVIGSQLCTAK